MWCIARETQDETDSLKHHGILGMKWGVRRYQNKDGTSTIEGKLRRRTNQLTPEQIVARSAKRKATAKKIATTAGWITLTAAIAMATPFVMQKASNKIYKMQVTRDNANFDEEFDNFEPVIVNKRTGETMTEDEYYRRHGG